MVVPEEAKEWAEAEEMASAPTEVYNPPPLDPVLIVYPRAGDTVRSILEIRGNAFFPGFQSYEVSYAGQANPDMWVRITHSTVPKANAVLAAWDTAQNPDGVYMVRLTAQDTAGRQRTQTVLFAIQNSQKMRRATSRRKARPRQKFPFHLAILWMAVRQTGWLHHGVELPQSEKCEPP